MALAKLSGFRKKSRGLVKSTGIIRGGTTRQKTMMAFAKAAGTGF
jgi:hypothetical protein